MLANSFVILVRHFFGGFFEKESLSPHSEPAANIAQLLGILAAPGAFFVILLLPLGPFGWGLAALRYFCVSFSMVVMGLIMVFEWDALFPDKRDYLILGPLPVGLGKLFLAKAAALGLLLGLFLVDVNAICTLFWPGVEPGPSGFKTMGAHAAAVSSAGLFTALSIASVQGVISLLLGGVFYRRVSVTVQTIFMAALIMYLFLTPSFGMVFLPALVKQNSPMLYWFPGFWFIGLYEYLNPAVRSPVLARLAAMAVWGLLCSAATFLLTFLPGYRRHARKALEAPTPRASGPGRVRAALMGFLNARLLSDPVERGVFHFITQTITRSPKHRLFLATYGGLGAALVAMNMGAGEQSLLRLPLILSFILVSGLRAAFNFPSDLRANWAFQISESAASHAYLSAPRKWILFWAVSPLFLLLAALEFASFSWPLAAFHLAFGFSLSVLLLEVMFVSFRKVPFACSYLTGKGNLIGLGVLYIFGFTTYSDVMARLESRLGSQPFLAAGFLGLVWLLWRVLARWRERRPEASGPLDFIDAGDPEVRTLELTSS
jgi:hypothetical protein